MRQHVVIYIPGLGDTKTRGQERAIALWKIYGVKSELFTMRWADNRPFETKFSDLLASIDQHLANGNTVSLVAASAGASAALNAYAARKDKINGVVLICGKVHNVAKMGPSVTRDNPSFGQSMDMVPQSLALLGAEDRARILSIHPLADESIPIANTRIEGARERTILTMGHFISIAFGITLNAPFVVRFLKPQAKLLAK